MTGARDDSAHLAVQCSYLVQPSRRGALEPVRLCGHPARDGRDCTGPFLHDLQTACGLWEQHPESHLIAAPVPDRWQGRRQRGGYDMRRGW